VSDAVDHQTAGTADALATVAVEGDRVIPGQHQLLIEHLEHLQERHVRGDVVEAVGDHAAAVLAVLLAPDPQGDLHL
jgi:hypothetical protein